MVVKKNPSRDDMITSFPFPCTGDAWRIRQRLHRLGKQMKVQRYYNRMHAAGASHYFIAMFSQQSIYIYMQRETTNLLELCRRIVSILPSAFHDRHRHLIDSRLKDGWRGFEDIRQTLIFGFPSTLLGH
jgi:hypothetical protein